MWKRLIPKLVATLALIAGFAMVVYAQGLSKTEDSLPLIIALWIVGVLVVGRITHRAGTVTSWTALRNILPVRGLLILLGFGLVIVARRAVGDEFDSPYGRQAVAYWLLGIAAVIVGCWPQVPARRSTEQVVTPPADPPAPPATESPAHPLAEQAVPEPAVRESWLRAGLRSACAYLREWWSAQMAAAPPSNLNPVAPPWTLAEIEVLAILSVIALTLRVAQLTEIPWLFSGDEGSVGQEARFWLNGTITNPFITGWSSHPMLYFILQSGSIALFGSTIYAVRITSAFFGALSVPVLYAFTRRFWGRAVALAAAVVLTGLAFHIHWSRIGLDPVYDPLFALGVLGMLMEGAHTGDRRWFVAAGILFGVALYFWGSRLLPFTVIMLGLYYLLSNWRRFFLNLPNWLAFSAVGLAIDLPLFVQFYVHPDDFLARMNQLGIFQLGLVAQAAEPWRYLLDQFLHAALAFNVYPDTGPFYHPGVPLLPPLLGALLVVGTAEALWHWRRLPEFGQLAVLLGTIVFGGMLMADPPQSHHYVIAVVPVTIFIGLALVRVGGYLRRLWGGPEALWIALLLVVAGGLAGADADWYLRSYSPSHVFGDVNTEVGDRLAERLSTLGDEYELYFFGPPRMWAGFPSVPYLAPDVPLYDLNEPLAGPPDFIARDRKPVFVFLPERLAEAAYVLPACPGGNIESVQGNNGDALFFWYLPPDGCVDSAMRMQLE